MKGILRKILSISLIALLLSCSAEKRIARIARNHPEVLQRDTIIVSDTVIVNGVRLDTVLSIKEFYTHAVDTIKLQKERLTVKIYHDTVTNQVFIEGQCDTVRIVREIEVPVEKIVVQDLNWWQRNNWWVIIVSVILVILYFAKNVIRNKYF